MTTRVGERSQMWWLAALALGALIVFMIVPEDFDYDTVGSSMPQSGSVMSRLMWTALMGISVLLVLPYLRFARLILGQVNRFFLAFCVLAAASVLWSIDPGFTIRRLVRLAVIVLVALSFVLLSGRRIQTVLRPTITAVLIGSILMVWTFPDLALERSVSSELAGAWHGLATQKNGLGSLAAIGTLLWVHAVLAREVRWRVAGLGLIASLVCLFYSRSSTSLLATAFTVPLIAFLLRSPPSLRRWMPWMVGAFAVGVALYSLAVLRLIPGVALLLRPIGMLTEKDPSFSGRTAIWRIVSNHIALRPFLGGGFGAYWVGPITGTASYEHVMRLNFYPTEAHNGYLDVVNDLGVLGAMCLLGYLFFYVRHSLRVLVHARAQGALYLGLVFEQLLENMSESRWFNVLCVQFVIMTVATFALARERLDRRLLECSRHHESRPGAVRTGPASAQA